MVISNRIGHIHLVSDGTMDVYCTDSQHLSAVCYTSPVCSGNLETKTTPTDDFIFFFISCLKQTVGEETLVKLYCMGWTQTLFSVGGRVSTS